METTWKIIYSKFSPLCSAEARKSYGFRTTWG